jgi:hypothetical protein
MAGEIDPTRVVDEAIEDGGRRSRDCRSTRVPFIDWDLASDDIGGYNVFENLEQIVTRCGFERLDPQSSRMSSCTPPSAFWRRA